MTQNNTNNKHSLHASYDLLNTVCVHLFNAATFISKLILQTAGLN